MTRTRTLLHYRVVVDRASGDWLTEPEHLGDVDRDTHLARPDTDAEHYDTHDLGDGCLPETFKYIAVTIVWKDPPVATNVPQFPAPDPEPAAPPPAHEVPQYLRAQLLAYVERYEPPGHFLGAVLRNDLAAAFQHGQPVDIAAVPALLAWLNTHAPFKCWGGATAMANWIANYDDGGPF